MKNSVSTIATNSVQASPSGKALRELYRTARHIYHSDPYAAARLARIADQAEYFLHAWPEEQWPTTQPGPYPFPSRQVLLAWAATAKRDATAFSLLPESSWSYAHWRQVTTTLLATLVPFA
ncbi:hypothetical protein HMJ29_18305 [Hymenobacter taeanensis]|uniref:Uncharacterized protein n=1 Tax=Hymenobacter taeanensis TaxID=2735321 RepID=A0A6M6BL94_9BACT|nr:MULTISPECIES: hypothetical protein [Hymenobacter]QJX48762.1 hypothetical protein HMJ29_18305 [Hymenobacter taeanensis]UOQ81733.1 hypothetical protein MUN83_02770 [Hymenobacter sp. 5414T-23]